MRIPLLPAILLAAALLPVAAPAAGADGAKTSGKTADKAGDPGALAAAMDALTPRRIECKSGTTANLRGKDGKWVEATLTAVDLAGVHYTAKDEAGGLCPWLSIGTASAANDLLKKAVDPKDAGHHLLAARVLANLKLGRPMADFHLKQAAQLEKSAGGPGAAEANAALALADHNRLKPTWAWPRLAPDQEADALRALDDAVQADAKKAGLRFIKDQNEFFIFYSDSNLGVAKIWAKKLTAAYLELCRTFDLDPRDNVWQGKCVVVVCKDKESYAKWMAAVAPGNAMAAKSAGLAIGNSVFAGSATIQFYHNAGNLDHCEKTLVHELCHAFTGQFHGNRHLASWANEGLAEFVCSKGAGFEHKTQAAREKIRRSGSLEDFFHAKNIHFDHYGAAFEITRLLLKRNPQGYARFVKAATEGADAENALTLHCGMTFDQLAALYAKSLGLRGLKAR